MNEAPSPEKRAQALVVARSNVPGGPWFVELRELLPLTVCLGPYQNPSIAQEDAQRIREFIAAVIRETRRASTQGRPED